MGTYHWLFGYVHQVFNVVILMFLKGRKEHVQHLLFISPSPFPIFFLFLLVFNLPIRYKTCFKDIHMESCIILSAEH